MIMDEFFDQFFPTEFLIEYLENGPEENMDRFHLRQRKIRLL